MAGEDEIASFREHIAVLSAQLERVAGELDTVKTAAQTWKNSQERNPSVAQPYPRTDGCPQFFNPKTMQPEMFRGGTKENFVAWARKVRNYLNAYLYGLRALLLKVETSTTECVVEHIRALEIPNPEQVSQGIHSFLIGATEGAPNTIVDNALGNGFEAWRRLVREYDPQSTEHNFGRMQAVMRQPRCKHLKDFTARVETWEREVRTLLDRTKDTIPE